MDGILAHIERITKELEELKLKVVKETSSSDFTPKEAVLHVLYDLETTGIGKTSKIKIREIGAVAMVDKGKEWEDVGSIDCKVDVLSKTNNWKKVGATFFEWVENLKRKNEAKEIILHAHNGKRFDARIVYFENQRHDLNMPECMHVDTLDTFKECFPGKKKSCKLEDYYYLACKGFINGRHTGLGDSLALRDIYMKSSLKSRAIAIAKFAEPFSAIVKRCAR